MQLTLLTVGLISLIASVRGIRELRVHNNPYGLTHWLWPLGIFVWGDAVFIGLFWAMVSGVSLIIGSLQFFLTALSMFWIVRSAGEVLYWFLQQFATVKRDKPETLLGHKLFPGESIWFAYQVFWQLILVISVLGLLVVLDVISL